MEKLNTLPLGKMYRITGSSSPDGPKGINKMLSEKRAQAVKEWLVARGIKELKTAVDGGGNVENGDSGMGMAKSRKVVIEEIQ
jgi:outer membrane protein OmpA-like peptidoglycan-associated protein